MKSIVNRTTDGEYYFTLIAEDDVEKVLLTNMKEYIGENKSLQLFGGKGEHLEKYNMQVDAEVSFISRSKG